MAKTKKIDKNKYFSKEKFQTGNFVLLKDTDRRMVIVKVYKDTILCRYIGYTPKKTIITTKEYTREELEPLR